MLEGTCDLGGADDRVGAHQQRADGEAGEELLARRAQHARAAADGEEREHRRAGEAEARARAEERRHRLDGDADGQVGRAPDQVDDPERDPDLPLGGSGPARRGQARRPGESWGRWWSRSRGPRARRGAQPQPLGQAAARLLALGPARAQLEQRDQPGGRLERVGVHGAVVDARARRGSRRRPRRRAPRRAARAWSRGAARRASASPSEPRAARMTTDEGMRTVVAVMDMLLKRSGWTGCELQCDECRVSVQMKLWHVGYKLC